MKIQQTLGAVLLTAATVLPTTTWAYNIGSGGDIAIKFGDQSWIYDRDNTLGNGTNYILQLADLTTGLSKGDELNFSFLISSIHPEDTSNAAFPNDIGAGEELTGLATGLLVDEIAIASLGSILGFDLGDYSIAQNFTGGVWAIYQDFTPNYDTSSLTNALTTSTDGTQIFGGSFGNIAGNNVGTTPYATEVGVADSSFTTQLLFDLDGNNDGTNGDIAQGNQGGSRGFLHETFDGSVFVPNNYGPNNELSIESTLTTTGLESWATLASNDPTKATVVPEPASIALLGLGFIALCGIKRRKQEQAIL